MALAEPVARYAVNRFSGMAVVSCFAAWICCFVALEIFGGPVRSRCFFFGKFLLALLEVLS
jgi:hypothetical protein